MVTAKAALIIMYWTGTLTVQPYVVEMSSYQACSIAARVVKARFIEQNANPKNTVECVSL